MEVLGVARRRQGRSSGEFARDDVPGDLQRDYVDATLAALFAAVVIATVIYGLIDARRALRTPKVTTAEAGVAGAALGDGNA
jgi:hypothetical protein